MFKWPRKPWPGTFSFLVGCNWKLNLKALSTFLGLDMTQKKIMNQCIYKKQLDKNHFLVLFDWHFKYYPKTGKLIFSDPLSVPLPNLWAKNQMVWYDLIWFDMTWHELIWYDMIWFDMIWYDLIWFDMIWYD